MTQNTVGKLSNFRQLIDDAEHFTLERQSTGEHLLVADGGRGLKMTESELNSLDKRIVPACMTIEGSLRQEKLSKANTAKPGFDATFLKLTIEHWLNPKHVTLATGAKLPCSEYGDVTSITKSTAWDVRMNPTILVLRPLTLSNQPDTYIVAGTMDLLCCVHPSVLDSIAPEWQGRFSAARSLGMEGKELSDYLLSPTQQALPKPATTAQLNMEV